MTEETILINLNSANAIKNNGSYLSDVYFNFQNIIKNTNKILEIDISVSNAQIPYSFYNINIYNNKLNITYNTIPYTLTLTRGNYNATNLISEIQTQFINNGITIVITISSITGTLLLSISTGTLILNSIGSTIYKVLGLEIGTNYTITNITPLTSPYPLNLLGTLQLKICSYNLITTNYDSSNMTTLNSLCNIPIESATFGIILYDNITNIKSRLNMTQIDGFDILILDDNNNPINFNNVDWSINLLITLIKEREQKNELINGDFYDYIKPDVLDTTNAGLSDFDNKITHILDDTNDTTNDLTTEPINDPMNSLDLLMYNNKMNPITGLMYN